jgi:hypothetical protein
MYDMQILIVHPIGDRLTVTAHHLDSSAATAPSVATGESKV